MVKHFGLLVGLLIGLFATGTVLASPDLVVADVALRPESPNAGDAVTITATIRNVGTHAAQRTFYVRFTVNGVQVEALTLPLGLEAGRSKTVSVTWMAQVGTHTIAVEVDQPYDKIDESNEANNTLVATLVVPVSPDVTTRLANLKVAVARFEDRSSSGFLNVGEGVADALVKRLVESGVRVLERGELEAVMQERGLNPLLTTDLATAGQNLGADLLVVGTVNKVNVQQASFSVGLFSFSSASVETDISARLVNVYTTEIEKVVSAAGKEEGATGFSVGTGKILSLSPSASADACAGGLRTNKPYYVVGETVHIGYLNPKAPAWYTVEIDTLSGGFIKWLDWQHITPGGCGRWMWDQRDMWNAQMSPGMYTVKLWDGTSYIGTVNFQIKLGGGLTPLPFDEITVGSHRFAGTIVGKATDSALNELVSELIRAMEAVAPKVIAAKGALPVAGPEFVPKTGQIAAILADGRVVINRGTSSGVSKGDFFEVLDTRNLVTDPASGMILSYDVLGVKGELVIVEVRDRISYGLRTSDFVPLVGDVVRLSTP